MAKRKSIKTPGTTLRNQNKRKAKTARAPVAAPTVMVPDVRGQRVPRAVKAVKDAGLNPNLQLRPLRMVRQGIVPITQEKARRMHWCLETLLRGVKRGKVTSMPLINPDTHEIESLEAFITRALEPGPQRMRRMRPRTVTPAQVMPPPAPPAPPAAPGTPDVDPTEI